MCRRRDDRFRCWLLSSERDGSVCSKRAEEQAPNGVGPSSEPKSLLIMKGNGTILLNGIKVFIQGDAHIQLLTPMQDNN